MRVDRMDLLSMSVYVRLRQLKEFYANYVICKYQVIYTPMLNCTSVCYENCFSLTVNTVYSYDSELVYLVRH